jgi:hypothetical protein
VGRDRLVRAGVVAHLAHALDFCVTVSCRHTKFYVLRVAVLVVVDDDGG